MGFKIKYKSKLFRKGSSGYGGREAAPGSSGDGGGEATPPPPLPRLPVVPPTSPSRDPTVLSISPLPLRQLRPRPPPTDEDKDEVPDDEGWGEEEDDDCEETEDDEDREEEKPTRSSSENKFYITLFMAAQRNIPHYIVQYDSAPLNKHEYFSLRKKWSQLLDGKRTYLRPPSDHRVLNDVFRCPDTRPRALGCQEPISALIREYPIGIIQEKIKILSQQYVLFRQTRRDGNCFYRAFFFSYLENLGQMQDSQAEVTRLTTCVSRSRENFHCLKWDKAYFLDPEAYFSSVVSEFNHLVTSVANGLSFDKLYERSLQEIMTFRILSFLRLLTEIEIRTQEEVYKSYIPQQKNVLEFCLKEVRPLDVEAFALQVRALTYALDIPLRVEAVDTSKRAGAVEVKRLDFFPRSEPGKGRLHLIESYYSSSTAPKPLEHGSGSLLSSDGTPLLTLLCRHVRCDILYRK